MVYIVIELELADMTMASEAIHDLLTIAHSDNDKKFAYKISAGDDIGNGTIFVDKEGRPRDPPCPSSDLH